MSASFKTGSMNGVPGADTFFLAVSASSLIGGFLFFYLETRTRITLLLTDADTAAAPLAISQAAMEGSIRAPVSEDTRYGAAPDDQITRDQVETDKKLLAVPFEALRTPQEFAAWAGAQARAKNSQAALRAIQEAVARDPNNSQYLELMANIRFALGNPQAAVDVYKEFRSKQRDDPKLLRRELLTALYLPSPASFNQALETADALLNADKKSAEDPMVQLWIAAARGQQYTWLIQNSGTEADKRTVRAAALAAAREVVRLADRPDAPVRQLLMRLLDPSRGNSASQDDDLRVFKDDPEFRSVILGEAPLASSERQTESDTTSPPPVSVSATPPEVAPKVEDDEAPTGRLPENDAP